MSSIGIVVRANKSVESLGHDWVPEPLGPRPEVEALLAEFMANADHLMLTANIEGRHESEDPRSITFSGVWGVEERAVLKQLCSQLDARFYDAEAGNFVAL